MMTRPAAEANNKSLVTSSLPFKNSKMSNIEEMITKKEKRQKKKENPAKVLAGLIKF
jgi:hypothetical protein